jgi:hypothetical protein
MPGYVRGNGTFNIEEYSIELEIVRAILRNAFTDINYLGFVVGDEGAGSD